MAGEQQVRRADQHGGGLPPDRLAAVQDGVGRAIDAIGGSFTMPYATVAVTATARAYVGN